MVDRVDGIVESVRLRIEAELRQQLNSLTTEHEQAILAVRRASQQELQEADRRWSALLAESRSEGQKHIQEAVTTARGQVEAEIEADREAKQTAAAAEAEAIRRFIGDLDRCVSLTDVLNHLAGAIATRPGSALFVAKDGTFQPWRHSGVPNGLPVGWEQLVDPAVRERTVQRRDGSQAVPLTIDRAVVAVLVSPTTAAPDMTPEVMASASAARLTTLTASRLLQAGRWIRSPGTEATATAPQTSEDGDVDANGDPGLSARRYARLLISEIKLYNETAVREGRERRDLAHRLGSEITRAREIYEARVAADVPGRARHFQDELVRTLADGDASLLA